MNREDATGMETVERAAQWLVTLQDVAATRADKESFVAWLRRSPVHVEEFLRVSSLEAGLRGRQLGFDADALVAGCMDGQGVGVMRTSRTAADAPRKFRWRGRPALAASFAVIAIVAAAIAAWWITRSAPVYVTERGEQRSVSLPDGSIMQLNTDTRIEVTYTATRRGIILRHGEALFTAAKDPNRPFVVQAGDHDIRVIGTRFSVSEFSGRTVVTVVEGEVSVAASEENARQPQTPEVGLSAGQQFVSSLPPATRVMNVDPRRAIGWQEWKLYFDNTSLADAVEEFNRYNRAQLRIADEELAQRRISGVFFANQPDSLIAFIDARDPVRVAESLGGMRTLHLRDQ